MRQLRLLLLCLPALALAACEREPALFLCDHEQVDERIHVDWSRFLRKETPTGMTLMLFRNPGDSLGEEVVARVVSNNIQYADFSLPVGRYGAYVFNQSDQEFGTVAFHHLDDWRQADVTASARSSSWYDETLGRDTANLDGDGYIDSTQHVVNEVEWIGTAAHDDIVLTQEQINAMEGQTIDLDTLPARNIIYTVTVYVHIKRISSLRSARSSLEGLASGYWLGRGRPKASKVVHLLERWNMRTDSITQEGRRDGTIISQISCFGLPYGHRGTPQENTLRLQCRLRNDSVLHYTYLVGDKFIYDENDNADLHFVIDITIDEPLPDVPDDDNSSSFHVSLESWDDEGTINVPM